MTPLRWGIFGAVCIAVFSLLLITSKSNQIDVSTINAAQIQASDHVFGNKDSKVVLIEYGDYQCPGCGGAYPQLKNISETYKGQIAFVFRNFPLTTIHPNALAAASAAEAAALQGKFWEMHDILYENQNSWQDASASERGQFFDSYAKSVGLDMAKFDQDLGTDAITTKIDTDRALGAKVGATSTPTIVLNGKIVESNVTGDTIQGQGELLIKMIEAAIKASDGTLPIK